MSAPTKKDIDLMANLMKVMNGQTPTKLTETSEQGGTSPVDVTPGVKRSDIDAMSKIIKGFSEATTSVAHKVKNTITESTKTDKGVSVGAFSVEKNAENRYDILDTRSDSILFEDIQLYETVCCIANHLNEGKTINSSEIMEIIRINELFERHYSSAVQHKHSYQVAKRAVNEGRMDIAQARFSQSKHEAGRAKRKITNLYEIIIL
jgi:hypothetical protein|tara:strand:+ start:411 stop:1028 length:618 start_codon:yes stop_codon:yes gene_type:complete